MSKTRVAVIGVGQFGRHHARHLAALPEVELVGVVDAHEPAARSAADALGVAAFSSPDELPARVDAVCIAVPTVAHYPVARRFLERGIATFVEKPLALSVEQAGELVRLAHRRRTILQVGHIERYNPVWTDVETSSIQPRAIHAQRYSPYPFRSLDVSVVFDVMIHDLDLVLALINSPAVSVQAVGGTLLSPSLDCVDASLRFANGCHVHLSASRVHHTTQRSMRLWDERRLVEVDFLRRTAVTIASKPAAARLTSLPAPLSAEARQALLSELLSVEQHAHDPQADTLRAELADFVRCVREQESPRVPGEHALNVLVLATRIEAAVANQSTPLRKSA